MAFAFSSLPASQVSTNRRLQHWCFTALQFSIVSELINAIPFLKAKRLPDHITQPSASPPNPCATGFYRKTTGTYGSSTRNHRVEAFLLSLSIHFSCMGSFESTPCQRCSEREEDCFTLLSGISNRALSKYWGRFSQKGSSLKFHFKGSFSFL